ncbi:hypothetical protein LO762_30680 [Actinocorallia sp. API 0066]|uniref:hypothetical protein n=1 Tax=Actinocorallia sp. API 0066 TaxID=2896846 RepID=UPI001E4AEA78|nr:hypothetical protein [Actinocorallia sp. API 0066]MCD0453518.1 hypothetical protein [Actinocorallia sp. API 0066]
MPLDPAWASVRTSRTVLAVAHNVTSLTRLLDVVALLEDDPRVQVVFTWTRSSVFTDGVAEFLADVGAIRIPWENALDTPFDLAVAASYGGELDRIKAPLIILSHGMGYNKYLRTPNAERRTPNAERRTPNAERRTPNAERRTPNAVFGLSRRWLVHESAVVPATIVLSHPEQLTRLAADCPEAVPAAVVAGDPCLDRILASRPWRARYRRELGVPDGARLVVATSTWGANSLFGRDPELLTRLTEALPLDEYRVAAVLHPNVWHGHSAWQVRGWLRRAERSGLLVIPPRDGWRATLVASDAVIGDHGSVAFYGAVLGRPLLYAAFPEEDVDARSPIARLAALSPRLDPALPPARQLDDAIAAHDARRYASVTAEATSAPGASGSLLRAELYRLMDLTEPTAPARVDRVPSPDVAFTEVSSTLVTATWHDGALRLRRLPWTPAVPPGAHLVVADTETDTRLFDLADVLTCPAHRLTSSPEEWTRRALATRPAALVAAAETPTGTLVATRDTAPLLVQGGPPALHPSAVHALLPTRVPLPSTLTLHTGPTRHSLTFTPL